MSTCTSLPKKTIKTDLYHSQGLFSWWQIDIFLIFPQKEDLTICIKYQSLFSWNNKKNTVINLITAHTPISTQSSDSVAFRLQAVYFLSTSLWRHMLWVLIWTVSTCWCNSNEYPQHMHLFFMKKYVVGTQFKWIPTTYAFIQKIRKKSHNRHQISPFLTFFIVYP